MDTSVSSGNGVIKVLPINSDKIKINNLLGAGGSITYDDITVKFQSKTSGLFQVDVVVRW